MKWQTDLVKDIRTNTDFDDQDGGVPHPLGYTGYYNQYGEFIYPKEVTDCNRNALLQKFLTIKDNCKAILEIGIGRNSEESFAYVFFKNKKKDTVYVGLDIDDRTFLDDSENNIFTIRNDSSDYENNVRKFKELGVEKFDFIFIDGWHSINQVLRDWEYTNLLADGGIVGFHDTSCHPGPHNFINSLDTTKWNVETNMCPSDWGIGFASKKANTKLEHFSNLYYISLEESVDRQNLLNQQFAEYNISSVYPIISKRFSECDDKITGEQLETLDPGTRGTIVSHLKAIKKWYDECNDSYAFFCEDDVSFETVKYWNFTWKDFIENLPEDAECVHLATVRPYYDGIKLREKTYEDWSATAYIITRDYAKKIIDRHIFGDVYDVTIPGNYVPMPENVLFFGHGKVYSIELFVENIDIPTTFKQIESNQKEYHDESYEYVINWWKNNGHRTTINELLGIPVPTREKSDIEVLLEKYASDTENPDINFDIGLWYENQGHNAPALSYFLRCAERATDDDLAYEALIHGANAYDRQGTRDGTAKGILQQALCLKPRRPEAYFLLARFCEKRELWQECYIYSSQGLEFADLNSKPLRTDVEYPGKYGLLYEKAMSSWTWGKVEECGSLFRDLYENYSMREDYRQSVLNNLKAHYPHFLVPENFDWGPTNPEYAQMFSDENFIERTYEKHRKIKANDIVLDIGANCGSFTYSILCKNPKKVYCVEPSNTLIDYLKKNVGHGPVTFINKAISDTEEENKVIADSGVYIYENDGNVYPTTTFKKLIEENNITTVDFLKFDCEGGEYSIFTKENYAFIRKNVKHFAGEWHINDHKDAVEKFIEFRDLYLQDCSDLHVYERNGKEVTQDIFNDQYLFDFREFWKTTYLGQFIIYVSYDSPEEQLEILDDGKMDIVLQGQYEEYTDEIIKSYLELPFVNNIIVSCWENDRPDEYHSSRVKFVRSKYPLTPGTCNKNLQIVTSFAGIKECRTKFSAKMRSDQKYTHESMMKMYEFMLENHSDEKIFVAGVYPDLVFHPRDHIFWGRTEDLNYLFDIPLEYNSLVDKVRIGKYELAQYANYLTRPETYIGAHYCTRFDDRIKRMLIQPENYLYDYAPQWNEAHQISSETLKKAFKAFPRTGIDLEWPKRSTQSYPYDTQKQYSNECWSEDGY